MTFQKPTKAENNMGGDKRTWEDAFSRRVFIEPRRLDVGDDRAVGGRRANSTEMDLVAHLDKETQTIRPEWRVLYQGRLWAIKSLGSINYARREIPMLLEGGQPT